MLTLQTGAWKIHHPLYVVNHLALQRIHSDALPTSTTCIKSILPTVSPSSQGLLSDTLPMPTTYLSILVGLALTLPPPNPVLPYPSIYYNLPESLTNRNLRNQRNHYTFLLAHYLLEKMQTLIGFLHQPNSFLKALLTTTSISNGLKHNSHHLYLSLSNSRLYFFIFYIFSYQEFEFIFQVLF